MRPLPDARSIVRRAAAIAAVVLLGVSDVGAQEADPVLGSFSFTSRHEPIEITSNRLDFHYEERRTTFRGDVNVVQGDIHLDCDVLTVHFREAGGQQELENVVADGNVKIRQGARTATGQQATFDESNRTLELTGNAVLEEGSNRATGDVIVVYPDESRMEIRGDNSRVKLLLFPKDAPSGSNAAPPAANAGAAPAPETGVTPSVTAVPEGEASPSVPVPEAGGTLETDGTEEGAPG